MKETPAIHKQENKYSKSFINYFIVTSLCLHVALFFLFYYLKSPTPKSSNLIEISFTEPQVRKQKQINPKLIVETETQAANNELSENAKFLSSKNNTVKKETKAKSGTEFKNSNIYSQNNKVIQIQNKKNNPTLFKNGFDAYAAYNKYDDVNSKKQLTKNSQTSSSTTDRLEKIEEDFITRLNTKEYRYYGYYSRIKTQLNQWWVPRVQQKFNKMLRQARTLASEEHKVTKLVIILNGAGNLVRVQVLAESGVRDLDDAAIEAFRQAAPFPNPPKGMIDGDGTVKIRWDCVVEG